MMKFRMKNFDSFKNAEAPPIAALVIHSSLIIGHSEFGIRSSKFPL